MPVRFLSRFERTFLVSSTIRTDFIPFLGDPHSLIDRHLAVNWGFIETLHDFKTGMLAPLLRNLHVRVKDRLGVRVDLEMVRLGGVRVVVECDLCSEWT